MLLMFEKTEIKKKLNSKSSLWERGKEM